MDHIPIPHTIQPVDIHLILHFIAPPSQLQSLPPHLISQSLQQRHHFLNIHPTEPDRYLCWPSPHQRQVIDLLETYQHPVDDHVYSTYPVRYTSDSESTYAHTHISSDDSTGLRIVFQWDHQGNWAFHDATIMPFPPNSYSSLRDAMSTTVLNALEIQSRAEFLEDHSLTSSTIVNNDDAYWDAYGQDDDDHSALAALENADTPGPGTEDAYWAQYATVQGSADSIQSSPITGRKFEAGETRSTNEQAFRTLIQPHRDLQGPSPTSLTLRLNAISPRLSPSSTPSLDSTSNTASDTPSPPPGLVRMGLALESPPRSRRSSPKPVPLNIITTPPSFSFAKPTTIVEPTIEETEVEDVAIEEIQNDEALRESIKGVFKLWKAGRSTPNDAGKQREERIRFLRIVREVIMN